MSAGVSETSNQVVSSLRQDMSNLQKQQLDGSASSPTRPRQQPCMITKGVPILMLCAYELFAMLHFYYVLLDSRHHMGEDDDVVFDERGSN